MDTSMGFLSAPVEATADQVYDFVKVRSISLRQKGFPTSRCNQAHPGAYVWRHAEAWHIMCHTCNVSVCSQQGATNTVSCCVHSLHVFVLDS